MTEHTLRALFSSLGLSIGAGVFIAACASEPEIAAITETLPALAEPNRTCINRNPLNNPYFGDTHVHTAFSLDAYTQDVRVKPSAAFAFAQGEKIALPPYNALGEAQRFAQLERALDFAMVSDHAEFFGDAALCTNTLSKAYQTQTCALYREANQTTFFSFNLLLGASPDNLIQQPYCKAGGQACDDHSITLWQQTQTAAELAYDRSDDCSFTSFIGYEWTGAPVSATLETQNLHRNVLFANAQVPARPLSYFNAGHVEDLWAGLATQCKQGEFANGRCDVLTIPHNSNLSAGLMFSQLDKNGQAIDQEYAQQRALFEPLVEIIQHKGSSECWAGGNDEACNFEAVPWSHLAGNLHDDPGLGLIIPKGEPSENSFVRHALKEGLKLEQTLGSNPFSYGFIGSTDTHLGAPGLVAQQQYPGHGGASGAAQLNNQALVDEAEYGPGGLAVVWAPQNTRTDLFAAMQRKEVYATSGPRHVLRFFAGDYPEDMCQQSDMLATAYEQGVPMGGKLTSSNLNTGQSPQFVVAALKDNIERAVDLQQIQIVKAWLDDSGATQEKVFSLVNVAPQASVDLASCEVQGVGSASLCQQWQDLDFDADINAFYYARVLENPSCRWQQYQCNAAQVDCSQEASVPNALKACCSAEIPKTVQQRSWSSPIWYSAN